MPRNTETSTNISRQTVNSTSFKSTNLYKKPEQTKRSVKRLNILITDENVQSIQSILDTAQGKAYADILSFADIVDLAQDAESALEVAGIPASFRKGAIYKVTPSGPTASAYRYTRIGTTVVIERSKSGWALIAISRNNVWPREKGKYTLTMTIDQKLRALHRFMKNFDISTPDIAQVLGFTSGTDQSLEQIISA